VPTGKDVHNVVVPGLLWEGRIAWIAVQNTQIQSWIFCPYLALFTNYLTFLLSYVNIYVKMSNEMSQFFADVATPHFLLIPVSLQFKWVLNGFVCLLFLSHLKQVFSAETLFFPIFNIT